MAHAAPRGQLLAFPLAAGLLAAGAIYAGYLTNPLLPLVAVVALGMVALAWARPLISLNLAVLLIPLDTVYLPLGDAALSPAEATFALTGAAWAVRQLVEGHAPFVSSPVSKPLGLFFLAILTGFIGAAESFPVVKVLVVWTAFGFTCLMVIREASPADVRRLLLALAFTGAVLGALGILGSGGEAPELTGQGENAVGRVGGAFGDPNIYATALTFAFPAALVLGLRDKVSLRPLLLLAAGLALTGLGLSLSRAGLLGAFGAILVMLAWKPLRRVALGLAMVLVALTALGANPLVGSQEFDTISTRLGSIESTGAASGDFRREIWAASPEIIRDHLPFGTGAGNFKVVGPLYGLRSPEGGSFDHAHSTPLTFAAELGILGVIALLWLTVAVIRACARACRWNTGEDQALSFALAGGLAAFGLHAIVNYMFGSNSIVALTLVFIGAAVVMARRGEERGRQEDAGRLEPSPRISAARAAPVRGRRALI